MRARLIIIIAIVIVAFIFLVNTVLVVDAGQLAVIFNSVSGNLSMREPGTHFMIPGVWRPVIYDARVQTYTMSSTTNEGTVKGDDALEATTKDGQVVKLDVSVRYHIDPEKVTFLHKRIGADFED